ncbi:MAG: Ferredoxin-1 [Bacteroidetes bacterium ADurb.Bin217]|nr:MAG: Ferredoxin-1 [Bacteroidetes bacterium ADurb.Bin217]
MIREIVTIDEELCNGCGECVPNCHEGALQMIDGKARLISDLMCDGLGACIGHCPVGAITIEKREAEAYNETKVMEIMVSKGKNTVIAHLKHLKDHGETEFLREGVRYLKSHESTIDFDVSEVILTVHNYGKAAPNQTQGGHVLHHAGGGCPSSQPIAFDAPKLQVDSAAISGQSQLRQWPVQLHLVNPMAQYFQQADVLLAADCVAFSLGNFHDTYLKGKGLAIACPKLDHGSDIYIQAVSQASRKIPIKAIVVGIKGEILSEEWI